MTATPKGAAGTTSTPRKEVDWEAVERDYRAGVKTLRAIADEHGCTHGAVNKRAKRDDWTRTEKPIKRAVPLLKADDSERSGFVYVIFCKDSIGARFFKIGLSGSFSERTRAHQISNSFELFVACAYFVPNMRTEERALHSLFSQKRVRGEWYALLPSDLEAIAARANLGAGNG